MIICKKCKKNLNNSKFRYLKFENLTEFKRYTCNDCWRGQPFGKTILKKLNTDERIDNYKGAMSKFVQKRKEINFNSSKRRAIKLKATPKWANLKLIREIYNECINITLKTKIPHHVDHILPLKGDSICGLHVHNNLQILDSTSNLLKSNRFKPYSQKLGEEIQII